MKEGQSVGEMTEGYIRTVNEYIKGPDKALRIADELVTDLHEYEKELGVRFNNLTAKQEYQESIVTLQKEKAEIMDQLREQIAQLDEQDHESTSYPEDQNRPTVGEVISNIRWDIQPSTIDGFTRREKKQILVAQAKYQIEQLYNKQLLEIHIGSSATDALSRKAFEAVEGSMERGEDPPGILAERLVETWLMQTIEDFDLPVQLTPADVYDDVVNKVDFFLTRKKQTAVDEQAVVRGVEVDASEETDPSIPRSEVGIQFVSNKDTELEEKKLRQLARIKEWAASHGKKKPEIELVQVELGYNTVKGVLEAWEKDGKPPGGPERYLFEQEQKTIFREVLSEILTREELDMYWEKIKKSRQGELPAV